MNARIKFSIALAFCALLLAGAAPAKAESITLTTNSTTVGVFTCTGTNGCFGNDITLDVSGSNATGWTVTLTINTTGNTNQGSAIGGVSFILTGFSYSATNVNLTQAPGGAGAWTEAAGPSSASGSGCQASSANSNCAYDTSLFTSTPTGADASPLGPGNTYVWVWTINNQTFGGFDASTHIQAIFGNLIPTGQNGCPGGRSGAPCFKETGLMSTNTGPGTMVPEPGTMALFGTGLLGLAGVIRRRMRS